MGQLILSRILSRIGFFTQIDKKEIEKNFDELSKNILNLKDMVSKAQIREEKIYSLIEECLNQQQTEFGTIQKRCQDILEHNKTINEIIENFDKNKLPQLNKTVVDNHAALTTYITNAQNASLKEIKTYYEDEIQHTKFHTRQEKEMMEFLKTNLLQQNVKMADIKKACDTIFQSNNKLKDALMELNRDKMTKDDLDVVSSFLRLLAANQLMQSASDTVENQLKK